MKVSKTLLLQNPSRVARYLTAVMISVALAWVLFGSIAFASVCNDL